MLLLWIYRTGDSPHRLREAETGKADDLHLTSADLCSTTRLRSGTGTGTSTRTRTSARACTRACTSTPQPGGENAGAAALQRTVDAMGHGRTQS